MQARAVRPDETFEQSVLPMALVSFAGTLVAANRALCRLAGRAREELVGLRVVGLMADETGCADLERFVSDAAAGTRRDVQVEQYLRTAGGGSVHATLHCNVVREPSGRPWYVAVTCVQVPADGLLPRLRDVERRLQEQADFFGALNQRASEAALVADPAGQLVYASPAAESVFGYESRQPLTVDAWDLVHPDDRASAQAEFARVVAEGGTQTWTMRVRTADGRWLWVEDTATNLLHTSVGGVVCNLRDVTARVRATEALRASEARYRAIADTAEEGIWTITPDGATSYANGKMADILGLALPTVYDLSLESLLDPAQARALLAMVQGLVRDTQRFETRYRHPDGAERVLLVVVSPLPGPDGAVDGALAMVTDVTDARRTEAALRRAALHDALTGMANRSLLLDRIEHALAKQQASGGGPIAVVFLDLDHFRLVNDSRGHDLGDRVLVAVAQRLTAHCRPADTVARFGGDEFVVVCEDVDEDQAHEIAAELLAALAQPFDLDGEIVHTTASIGIACSPPADGSDLLRFADAALHMAKSAGVGRVRTFHPALAEEADRRYLLGTELRAALARGELGLHYQPVIELTTGSVVGMEGLARWTHPVHGEIPPDHFVPIAEQVGLEGRLDAWALRTAARDASTLRAAGSVPTGAYVAVNLSARSIAAPGLEEGVVSAAAGVGLAPERVVLEITEGAVLADVEHAVEVLSRLRAHGFGVAIDDFGTGYSSLSYLKSLPITSLKIDRSFVADICENSDALAIVASIVDLARAVGVTTVAEGVETSQQAALLQRLDCTAGQGWLWSAAVPVADLLDPAGPDWRRRQRRPARSRAPLPAGQVSQPDVGPEHGIDRLLELHREGASLVTIAAALNGEGYRTPVGARWHPTSVARAVAGIAYPDLTKGGRRR